METTIAVDFFLVTGSAVLLWKAVERILNMIAGPKICFSDQQLCQAYCVDEPPSAVSGVKESRSSG